MIQKIMNYDKRKSTITEQQVNAHKRRKIKLKKFMAEILLNLDICTEQRMIIADNNEISF